jgi:predicted nicotinamide N-methyase
MSSKNAISSGGEKTQQKRSCLAVVEADGLFDDRRRVRLPLPSPSSQPAPSNKNHAEHINTIKVNRQQEEVELLGLKQSLANALGLPSIMKASGMEIELYDTKNQSFRKLIKSNEISATCCRLRISMVDSELLPSQPPSSCDSNNNTNCELLALPWREFSSSIDLDGKLVLKGGRHSIIINEVSNSGLGTGTNIWDGAIALAKFLELHDRDEEDNGKVRESKDEQEHINSPTGRNEDTYSVRGKRILEIGAGTGLVGIAAHVAFGAREVILTDLEYSLDNLRDNLKANACRVANSPSTVAAARSATQPCTIDAMVLDWFNLETCDEVLQQRSALTTVATTTARPSTTYNERDDTFATSNIWIPDIVVAADVVWVESLVRPLVQTLHRICMKALSSPPLILLSYQRRSQAVEDLLFRTLEEFCFRTEDVTSPVESTTSGAESKIRIYRITHTPRVD